MNEKPPRLKVTQFAMIDTAMLGVVKAATDYERAAYTTGERDALDRLVKAGIGLKDTFLKVMKEINAAHEQGADNKVSERQ